MPRLIWSFPCSSGDFRLLPKDDLHTVLEIERETDKDRAILGRLLTAGRERDWIGPEVGLPDRKTGRKPTFVIEFNAPMSEVGPALSEQLHGKDVKTWTAIRYSSGVIEIEDGVKAIDLTAGGDKGAPEVAVTVREPQRGCPAPSPADRRASEVLAAFSTSRQWAQWTSRGFMELYGVVTGKLYRLRHHNEAVERGLGHLLIDVETGREICVYDPLVPAPEEALAIKLAVEHREAWLLEKSAAMMGAGYA